MSWTSVAWAASGVTTATLWIVVTVILLRSIYYPASFKFVFPLNCILFIIIRKATIATSFVVVSSRSSSSSSSSCHSNSIGSGNTMYTFKGRVEWRKVRKKGGGSICMNGESELSTLTRIVLKIFVFRFRSWKKVIFIFTDRRVSCSCIVSPFIIQCYPVSVHSFCFSFIFPFFLPFFLSCPLSFFFFFRTVYIFRINIIIHLVVILLSVRLSAPVNTYFFFFSFSSYSSSHISF